MTKTTNDVNALNMRDLADDPKQTAILEAAWTCFAAYGFRKTSMDDIAREAGMSRPAIYLQYRNKGAIFRSLAQLFYDTAVENVSAALSAPGPAAEQLKAAFLAQGGEILASMLTSAHGMELLDSGKTEASDIVETGESRLTSLYAQWLNAQVEAGRIRLDGDPDAVAGTMTSALKGIKMETPDYPTYCARVGHLADLFGRGLAA